MDTYTIKNELLKKQKSSHELIAEIDFEEIKLEIYLKSIIQMDGILFFIVRKNFEKFLYLLYDKKQEIRASKFYGEPLTLKNSNDSILKKCELNTENRIEIQKEIDFLNPILIGLQNSFGFGDRIGLANPGHIRSLEKSKFKPVLAQQSIRELTRTNRTPAEVMDAAVWAILQEGYSEGFGADADHLKTTEDIDLMVKNGFTMFTFDPGEHVHNEADSIAAAALDEAIKKINWQCLNTNYITLEKNYLNKSFNISEGLLLEPARTDIKRAVLKYGDALAHIKNMYDHLKLNYPLYQSEVEVSVDETDSVTSPFEHFFIVNELNRMNVQIISLAPRFVGSFEKGIDYKGDLNLFKIEYLKHLAISKYFGRYKLSLHSGSDKFSVYKIIGEINEGFIHVKTAGTSYLEALKVAAIKQPDLFKEIFDFSKGLFETEKKSYHVSADVTKLKSAKEYTNKELLELFDSEDARQVLHVTFGKVLTDKNKNGEFIFKAKLIDCLKRNEDLHSEIIFKHFKKHLNPFGYHG